ncbi:2328_t:CDS:2, partial [Paraglomus occultum]
PMYEEHIHKTTFTCHLGLFSFLRLPFGLKNAPASFQAMMDLIFGDQIDKHMAVFIDDINIYSQTFEEHMDHLRQTFEKCRKYGLKLKKKKCYFGCEKLEFLGHVVSREGLIVDDRKVNAVEQYGTPKDTTQIKQFLGMTGYYAQFINGYQEMAAPLQKLLGKRKQFVWTTEQDEAMQQLKDALITSPVLAYPNMKEHFTLITDASNFGLGAVLAQYDPITKQEYAVGYASKSLSPAERNYSATHREGLAVKWALKKFQRYLRGRQFTIVTDHAALLPIIQYREPEGRTGRWAMELMEYDFDMEHRKGEENQVADALSRDPTFGPTYEELKVKALNDRDYRVRRGAINKWHDGKWKLVIKSPDHEEIIRSIHDGVAAGHLGVKITCKKIKERYWWPGINKMVQEYISTCVPCQKEKKPEKPKDIYPIIAERPFQIIGIDHVGPLHETKEGYLYLIVAQDYFTKWPMAKATKTTNTDEALEFLQEICATYGAPEQIISDRGSAFISEKWKTTLPQWGIKHTPTTAANPQANGQVERFNQTLVKMLRKRTGVRKTTWAERLPFVLWDYRTSVQATMERTPSELLYGYRMRIPIELKYPIPEEDYENQPIDRLKQLEELHHKRIEAAELIKKKQEKVKQQWEFNKGLATPFQVGDLVLLYAPAHKRKLDQAAEGPFRIKEVGKRRTYVLETLGGKMHSTVTGKRLIKFNERNKARVEI